jgi:hypothetical protein
MFENYFYIHKPIFSSGFIIAANLLKDKPCMLLQSTTLFGIAKAWLSFQMNIRKCILTFHTAHSAILCHVH